MRDRLIELIADVQYMGGLEEKLADHLLAEGVIVPPCKVGDLLYMPWEYDGVKDVAGLKVVYMVIDTPEFRVMTDFTTDCEDFFDLYNGGKFTFSDFGKTVFLTREEAEKALKERREG